VRARAEPRDAGQPLSDKQFVQGYIADSYAQLLQFRLFVLYTAWEIDKYNDYKKVRKDIAAVKVVMPTVLHDIAWRACSARRARCHQRDAVHADGHGRRGDGTRRRPDRGAQGHRRQAGAARLPAQRRHLADRWIPRKREAARRSTRDYLEHEVGNL
jgi:acyl-CoA dehydrogenase